MRRFGALALALTLAACAASAVSIAERDEGTGSAAFVGAFHWTADLPAFGGFSGLDVGADGLSLLALSDRTALLRGRIERDARGAVIGVAAEAPEGLLDEGGRVMQGPRADSEGLAVDALGHVFVSFEGRAVVRRLGEGGGPATLLPEPDAWRDLAPNQQFEALAVDARDGTLFVLAERPDGDAFPVWRLAPGARQWEVAFRLPARDGFAVTDADVGPDGRLTVLERDFTGLGFRSRLRRVALDGTGEETLWTTGTGAFDNLEGLSIWRDEARLYGGGLRATMVSDDNFRFFQETQLVDLALPD